VFRSDKAGVAYDHSSVIASLLDWFQIRKSNVGGKQTWSMGARVDAAPTLWHAFGTPGGEAANVHPDDVIAALEKRRGGLALGAWDPATPLPALDVDFFARGLSYMSHRECVGPALETAVGDILGRATTWGDLRTEIHRFRKEYRA
jgi:hypothetical protein